MQLGFAKAHHKITPREKCGRGPGLGKLPNISGPLFNIFEKTKISDLKIGTQVGFAKAHHKIPSSRKSGHGHDHADFFFFWGSL